ncbi:DUF1889 family protein [Rhodanobacter sp. FW102-FHT14D06]|uniref:DUF1889 family protein n=2 Tax=unclassified Rhodanobacter TaxID=2621553 RepID=A0AB74UUK4_9GAMM
MLRINGRTLPALPRPVFEIQAEHTAEGDIRVTVMAGQGEDSRVEEFPMTEQPLLERRVAQWFRGLPYFEPGHSDWASESDRAAILIGQWTSREKSDITPGKEMTMREIVQKAMEKLSRVSNVSTGLAHPLDEARAKELFIALRDHGVPLSQDDVRLQAEACGWPARHAQKLGELAECIGEGAAVPIAFPRGWGEGIVGELLSASS